VAGGPMDAVGPADRSRLELGVAGEAHPTTTAASTTTATARWLITVRPPSILRTSPG
jgi:hypothetical protein